MADQRSNLDQRPSPEALLEAARREETRAGKLRIFVGAAPGVGKTYEMLQQARARKKDGHDVIVGVVETHGRKETEALLEGLEVDGRIAVILSPFDISCALEKGASLECKGYTSADAARLGANVMLYASGLLLGPLAEGVALDAWNPHGLMVVLGAISLIYVIFLMVRRAPPA